MKELIDILYDYNTPLTREDRCEMAKALESLSIDKFNIEKYKHSDDDVCDVFVHEKTVEYVLPSYTSISGSVEFNKNDAIVLAKHYGLIE